MKTFSIWLATDLIKKEAMLTTFDTIHIYIYILIVTNSQTKHQHGKYWNTDWKRIVAERQDRYILRRIYSKSLSHINIYKYYHMPITVYHITKQNMREYFKVAYLQTTEQLCSPSRGILNTSWYPHLSSWRRNITHTQKKTLSLVKHKHISI